MVEMVEIVVLAEAEAEVRWITTTDCSRKSGQKARPSRVEQGPGKQRRSTSMRTIDTIMMHARTRVEPGVQGVILGEGTLVRVFQIVPADGRRDLGLGVFAGLFALPVDQKSREGETNQQQ
jgi:hypothetical protein